MATYTVKSPTYTRKTGKLEAGQVVEIDDATASAIGPEVLIPTEGVETAAVENAPADKQVKKSKKK